MINEVNLCSNCVKKVPTCKAEGVKFGSGKGNDNVVDCHSFEKNLRFGVDRPRGEGVMSMISDTFPPNKYTMGIDYGVEGGDTTVMVDIHKCPIRPTREEVFMGMAELMAERSVCLRKKVGAVIVKDGRPIVVGYNGPPSGYEHCTEETCKGADCDISIHAEMNAVAFAAKEGLSIDGCVLYTTLSPCINCAKVLINTGIKEVIYSEEYRKTEGITLLKKFIAVSKRLFESRKGVV